VRLAFSMNNDREFKGERSSASQLQMDMIGMVHNGAAAASATRQIILVLAINEDASD